MDIPSHRERQYMQRLRAGGWVKLSRVPAGARLIKNLLAKGWIEKRGITATEVSYRLTDKGLAAKKGTGLFRPSVAYFDFRGGLI
jgi:hypothetical protein